MALAPKAPELDIDEKSISSFIAWFKKLEQDETILRIFDRKGFFSVHGSDTATVAKLYGGSGVVKQLGVAPNQLTSVAMNRSLFEQLLRSVLVEQGDRVVELYEGHGASWRLSRHASPGCLTAFEEELFSSVDMVDTPMVMAVTSQLVEGCRTVGIAYIDAACRRLGAAQFEDDEQLCALERVLVQLGAKEVVIPQDTATSKLENEKVERVVSDCDSLVARRPRITFSAKDIQSNVEVLLKEKNAQQHEDVFERPLASSALAAVLAFADVASNAENHGRFTLDLYKPDEFMRLDMAAQRALHVLPARAEARGNSTSSVYGILNHTRTAMGKRLLRSWLKQPLTDVVAISERHTIVQAFVDDLEMREAVRDCHLRGIADVQRLSRKLSAKKVTLQELCQLYMASNQLPALVDVLDSHEGEAAELMQNKYVKELTEAHGADALVKFEELLEAAIDLDAVPEEYLIDAGYDTRLQNRKMQDIKADKEQATRSVQKEAQRIADDLGLDLDKSIKLEWFKSNNVSLRCMRITQKEVRLLIILQAGLQDNAWQPGVVGPANTSFTSFDILSCATLRGRAEKQLRSRISSKYTVLETRKDGTKFTSKHMKEFAASLNEASKQYADVQRSLIDSVRDVASTYVQVWEVVGELLAELDVLASFADVATSSRPPFVRPEMLGAEEGEITLVGSRHPCLELQDGVDVIANDCEMKRCTSWFQLVTGPNMGGKSTYIRQVGVSVLMAQVGSFVPCDSARISVRDCIFARVGAGDCQQKGVSTFMAEMLETAAILKGATHRSLIIIDELGRGTSTYDGFGLAWALSEHIMQVIGAPTLFATHFHELTAISGPVGVKNRHMQTALDPQTSKLTMLYRIVDGACDQSFGIHVAEFANFPPEVIARAKEKLAQLEVGGKRPRDPSEEAQFRAIAVDAIKAFLKDFAALPVAELGDDAVTARVEGLKAGLLSRADENPVLRGMLTAGMH